MIAQLVSRNELGRKRLVISTDSEYSTYLREVASQGKIIDSDSTKLLVLDGGLVHPDIYTAHIPYYGTMYKAGYIASRMEDVDSVRIYLANSKYLYMRESFLSYTSTCCWQDRSSHYQHLPFCSLYTPPYTSFHNKGCVQYRYRDEQDLRLIRVTWWNRNR